MHTSVGYGKTVARKRISNYQENAILNASPEELILKLYDLGILSIKKGDIPKANKVLAELISALNFDYQDVALGFFKLYRFCQNELYKGNTEMPIKILTELRQSWAKAFNLV